MPSLPSRTKLNVEADLQRAFRALRFQLWCFGFEFFEGINKCSEFWFPDLPALMFSLLVFRVSGLTLVFRV